ncbi:PGF-pre-PGF domain-containing protein [Halohasta litorea]|uniref:PGF-pre-PGF domain-containing protein n=1 Tax=Halohasta litorea TaxID=869891 RepID=A0ABD6DEL5_9EURY|nr:PGF-pre-PGF domain-containing protein [Halohasta litorea]
MENSYWDVGTTTQTASVQNDGGTVSGVVGFGEVSDTEPASEMQRFGPPVTMDALSFDNPQTWTISDGYPALAWQNVDQPTVESLTAETITTAVGNDGQLNVTAFVAPGDDAGEGVNVTVTDDGGINGIVTGDSVRTDENGNATFSFTEETAGEYTLAFELEGNGAVSDSSTITVELANSVDVGTQPTESTAGESVSGPPQAIVTTASGLPVRGVDVSVSEANGYAFDNGTTTVSTNSSGIASFDDLEIETAGDYNLDFEIDSTDPNVSTDATVSTNGFSVRAAAADSVTIDTQPASSQTAGKPITGPPAVTVTDEFGNPVAGVDVSVSETNGFTFDAATTTRSTDSSGIVSFDDLEIETAGDYGLDFTIDSADANVATDATVSTNKFDVVAAVANSLSIVEVPDTITAGESVSLKFNATDEFDNPAADQQLQQFTLSSEFEGILNSSASVRLNETGEYVVVVDVDTVTTADNSHTLTADADSVGSESVDIAVEPAESNTLTFVTQPDNSTAGESITGENDNPISVDIRDKYGNVVDDFSDKVTLAVETGDGTLSGDTVVDANTGVAVFAGLSIETADDYMLNASAEGVANETSLPFSVEPAGSNTLAFVTQPDNSTAGEPITGPPTVSATDEFDNPVEGVDVDVTVLDGAGTVTAGETTKQTNTTGIAVFDALETQISDDYRLQFDSNETDATVETSDTIETESFAVEPAQITTFTAPNVTATAGITERLNVTVSDTFGNPITDEVLNVTDTDGLGGLAPGKMNHTNETGEAGFVFTEHSSGNYTVDIAVEADPAINTTANVSIERAAVDSLSVSLADETLTTGESTTLTAEATYINETTLTVTEAATLTSNNTAIATVDANGTVQANGTGSTDLKSAYRDANDTVAVSVSNPPSSSGSSGSSSGSGDDRDGDTEDEVPVEINEDGSVSATTTVTANEPTRVDLGDSVSDDESDTNYNRVDLTFGADTEVTFEARSRSRDELPDGTPQLGGAAGDGEPTADGDSGSDSAISYVEFTVSSEGVDASDRVSSATIEFDVATETLADRDLGADDIALNRYDEDAGEWTELDTEIVSEGDSEVTYESTTPGFSVFAVGERADEMNTEPTDDSTEPIETNDDTPGFGLLVGLVSLLTLSVLVGRFQRTD